VDRFDPQGGSGANAFTMCGSTLGGQPHTKRPGSGSCDVAVGLDHPAVEAAVYHGQITFPWQGGDRTVGFNALCSPGAGCADLPVDAGSLLAPLGGVGDGDGHVG
jgi:hypothetical protein